MKGKTLSDQGLSSEIFISKEEEIKESISDINYQESKDYKVGATILNKIVNIKILDFSICNCENEGKSSHFCDDCNEGFCEFCVKAHQRFKVTRMHKIIGINHYHAYYCNCKSEEKSLAEKYCTECSEFFCVDCIDAHQKLIVTRNHVLKSI